ncbi:MAG: hypothetical protein Q4G16_04250 [Cruoricaptor ignavus]|nr:hypothetical protein [Cruoricaptor ignavus]
MKRKFLVSILLLTLTYGNAQKIKSENLEFTKTVQPKLLKTQTPIDITLIRTTSSEPLKNNALFNTYVSVPNYIINNTSTPEYIAVLDYTYKPMTNKIGKLGTLLNELYLKSNTNATLYLMLRDKGVFYKENIELRDNSQDNWKSDKLGVTAALRATVSDADAGKFLVNGEFRPEIITELEKKQIERLTILAYQTIRDGMSENDVKNRLNFNFLRSDKEFSSPDFDNAYSKLKNNINPINKSEINSAIEIWKNEANKITDVSDKTKKKYKIAILENILNAQYIVDDYNSDVVENELKNLDEKNGILYFYTQQKNNFQNNNQQIKDFTYTSLPSEIFIPEANKGLFTTNNSGSSNESYAKINKLNFHINWDYNPILNLNNLKYQVSILKDEDKLFLKYQNFLMDEILWYMMNIKRNAKALPGKTKSEIEHFIAFSEKLNNEYDAKKIFKFADDKNYRLMKAREYFSENYKLPDLFQYIPNMDSGINIFFENKNTNLSNAFKDVAEINSIVQLRKFVYDNYYENRRKEKESELDNYVESKAQMPTYKNEVYYEFKNSIGVLGGIEGKRLLSDEEYQNYQLLMNHLLYKLNTYN